MGFREGKHEGTGIASTGPHPGSMRTGRCRPCRTVARLVDGRGSNSIGPNHPVPCHVCSYHGWVPALHKRGLDAWTFPPVRHQHPRNQVPRFERETPFVFHVHRISCTSHERIHEVRSIPRERRQDTPTRRGLPSHLTRYKLHFGQGTAAQRPRLEWS